MASRRPPYADRKANGRRNALRLLLDAHETAFELGTSDAEFASQLTSLQSEGVTDTVLRWLICQGLAEHILEITDAQQKQRKFRTGENLCFTKESCFTLTPAGRVFAEKLEQRFRHDGRHQARNGNGPRYDASRRILFLGDQVVKQFKVPAKNQELILLAFEEEHWPVHLSDPLPGTAGVDAKARLNDAIRSLNARQNRRVIRFQGDGTGCGIVREILR